MDFRSEKRPSPFDDDRPSLRKQLKLPSEDSMSAKVSPMNEGYDTCFGMIYCTASGLSMPYLHVPTDPVMRLQCSIIDHMVTVHHKSFRGHIGFLDLQVAKALGHICEQLGSILEAYIPSETVVTNNSAQRNSTAVCIVIYGMHDRMDQVSKVLSDFEIYLQHPRYHSTSIPYDNPQYLLRPEGKITYEDGRDSPSEIRPGQKSTAEVKRREDDRGAKICSEHNPLKKQIDQVFDSIQGPQEFSKISASGRLSTTLKKYQEKALSMMLEKESGMIEGNRFGSLWTICTLPNGQRRYKNVVTKTLRTERPSLCLGGILADEMGLGKTLTALALIATSLDRTDQMNTMWCRTTLIVTPMSLLSSWEEQLKSHLHSGTITWIVYHGDAKRSSVAFEDYDVVLTTYDTIAAGMVVERNFNKQSSNSLTSFDWYRVVLDEAHLIRNISTARHNAVRALKAQHRWCITGTPIFNRVEDLGSLLNFLRIHHFDAKSFADHIVRPLKHDPVLGLANLKSLLQAVSLRRTKASVSGELCLAPRIDRVENVQLTSAERRLYNMVRRGFSQHLSSSNKKGGPPGHVFQTILRLRQLCNLGFDMIQSRNFEKFKDARNYERLALFLLEGSDTCTLCGENVQGEHTSYAKETDLTCGHQFCGLCMERNFNPTMVLAQDCPVCSGFLESSQHDDHEQPVRVSMSRDRHEPSSKLRALLGNLEAEIQARTSGTSSKSIVISSWTQVLDVVEAELNTKSIGSTRIDGGKSESKRREALTKFRTEDSCSILLASLGSVGVGLNLTVASNIHLLEPQWSPMAEEQALDRVYRLGQTYQVVATRYIVENSIEQYVVAVQRAKIRVIRSSVGEDLPTEANQDMQKLMKYIADSPADCED